MWLFLNDDGKHGCWVSILFMPFVLMIYTDLIMIYFPYIVACHRPRKKYNNETKWVIRTL